MGDCPGKVSIKGGSGDVKRRTCAVEQTTNLTINSSASEKT